MVAIYTNTQTTEILWRKRGCVAALQVRERAPDPPPGQAFIVFLGTLHGGWSSFTMHRFTTGEPFKEDKGQNTANYFKEKDVTAQGGSYSHSILGWFSKDFREMKILSKHLLPQFRVREF